MGFIQAQELTMRYGQADSTVIAIDRVSLTLDQGDFMAVMGPSGSGKSTLLSILGGLTSPSEGTLVVDDIDIYSLTGDQRADFRREYLGFVFQSFHLIEYLTIAENVMLPLVTKKLPTSDKRDMAAQVLGLVGLDGKENRLPGQVSGGEQERAAIARAIVNRPAIIMADEPTGSLDTKTGQEIMTLIGRLNDEGATVIMVTHSGQCAEYADRIIGLKDGRLTTKNEKAVKVIAA